MGQPTLTPPLLDVQLHRAVIRVPQHHALIPQGTGQSSPPFSDNRHLLVPMLWPQSIQRGGGVCYCAGGSQSWNRFFCPHARARCAISGYHTAHTSRGPRASFTITSRAAVECGQKGGKDGHQALRDVLSTLLNVAPRLPRVQSADLLHTLTVPSHIPAENTQGARRFAGCVLGPNPGAKLSSRWRNRIRCAQSFQIVSSSRRG